MVKRHDYDTQDLREWNKIRNKIQDPKWQNYTLHRPKKQLNHINLGIHEDHNWQPLKGPFGPHSGKIICKSCNDKWIAWLPKGTI
jgi:hypothetical protein